MLMLMHFLLSSIFLDFSFAVSTLLSLSDTFLVKCQDLNFKFINLSLDLFYSSQSVVIPQY